MIPHQVLAHLHSQPEPVILATCDTEQDLRRVYRRERQAWEQGGMDGDVVGIEMGLGAWPERALTADDTWTAEQLALI